MLPCQFYPPPSYSSEEHSKDLSNPEKKKTWNSDGLESIKWTWILTFPETDLEGIIIGTVVTWPWLDSEIPMLELLENIGETLTTILYLKMTWSVMEPLVRVIVQSKRNFKVFEEVYPATSMKVSFISFNLIRYLTRRLHSVWAGYCFHYKGSNHLHHWRQVSVKTY